MTRAYLKLFFSVVLISTLVAACGKDKNNNGNSVGTTLQCDPTGYCYPVSVPSTASPPYYTGYNNNYPVYNNKYKNTLPSTTVILGGNLNISNSSAWQKALDGMQNCQQPTVFFGNVSVCGWASGGKPYLEVSIYDYKFSKSRSSQGSVSLMNPQNWNMAPQLYYSTWSQLTTPAGFETFITAPYQYGQASALKFTIQGRSTDSSVPVVVRYGSAVVGSGTLIRLNR